jgi:hypothetical protein
MKELKMSKRYMLVSYMQKANGLWDELTDFKDNLKLKDIQNATVVLDHKEKKVVKNRLNSEAGYDDMLEFYKRTIGDQLTPYLP